MVKYYHSSSHPQCWSYVRLLQHHPHSHPSSGPLNKKQASKSLIMCRVCRLCVGKCSKTIAKFSPDLLMTSILRLCEVRGKTTCAILRVWSCWRGSAEGRTEVLSESCWPGLGWMGGQEAVTESQVCLRVQASHWQQTTRCRWIQAGKGEERLE